MSKVIKITNIPNAVEVHPFVQVGWDGDKELVECVTDYTDPAIIGWGVYWHVDGLGVINIRDYVTREEAETAAVLLTQALEVLT